MGRHIERMTYLAVAVRSGSELDEDDRKTIAKIILDPDAQQQWMAEQGETLARRYGYMTTINLDQVLSDIRQVPFDEIGVLAWGPVLLSNKNIGELRELVKKGAVNNGPLTN